MLAQLMPFRSANFLMIVKTRAKNCCPSLRIWSSNIFINVTLRLTLLQNLGDKSHLASVIASLMAKNTDAAKNKEGSPTP